MATKNIQKKHIETYVELIGMQELITKKLPPDEVVRIKKIIVGRYHTAKSVLQKIRQQI